MSGRSADAKPGSLGGTIFWCIVGALFAWSVAVTISQYGELMFNTTQSNLHASFAAMALTSVILVATIRTATGGPILHIAVPLAAGGTLYDGIAICFFPHVYGVEGITHTRAAAWIFFGVGLCLTLSLLFEAPPRTQKPASLRK
eukprot:TRINITY_DN713_c0_g1_i1.p1 TRINITY_DN713_c0_g1~~TRINITY_DN713_c0_g1_i1.p1  ORF type:complete len:144 (+),score=37.95 TRINITY_DN713_c0_g1_i1:276-707(+)